MKSKKQGGPYLKDATGLSRGISRLLLNQIQK